ncbi:MAG: ATP phosphoribosyltransferase regulatory subunit [Rhodospirillaceae bacterium]|nr:ATP phosphoribosyltransferase regulatory subunit [Rhodospirillaceae bacterium]|tara:strand:+ start:2637 stop:3800 length:1164 start_codon:yes stop_codon:yes gene_type:complete
MTDTERNTLLPAGLSDILPEDAAFEAETVDRLISCFSMHGYQRVKPPLLEFEESLLSGVGVAVEPQTFRLMDPVSQRMMGMRADITPQISRIAQSRLVDAPRPLRLSYAGDVLRVRGSQLRPERQLTQVGAELIGSAAVEADAEIIVMAIRAIQSTGIEKLTVDLTMPRLVQLVLSRYGLSENNNQKLRQALDRKDAKAVSGLAGKAGHELRILLSATGVAHDGLKILKLAKWADDRAKEIERISCVVDLLTKNVPEIQLTIDPVEHRGFEYHTGIGFTIFSQDPAVEFAGGGRYRVKGVETEDGERATGVTLYIDSIMTALKRPEPNKRVYIPIGSPFSCIARLHDEGWITVSALQPVDDVDMAAQNQKCYYVYDGNELRHVKGLD